MAHDRIANAGDIGLAGSMVTSPAWVPWLEGINQLLTTVTLLLGMALAVARLWAFWKERRARKQDAQPEA